MIGDNGGEQRLKPRLEALCRIFSSLPGRISLYLSTAFACLSVVYGGTYMLNKPECKIGF
ncbi:hypothetical protein ACSBR1_021595 [Camellia fascicularis]